MCTIFCKLLILIFKLYLVWDQDKWSKPCLVIDGSLSTYVYREFTFSKVPHKSILKFILSPLGKFYFDKLIITSCWAVLAGQVDTKIFSFLCSANMVLSILLCGKDDYKYTHVLAWFKWTILWCVIANRAKFRIFSTVHWKNIFSDYFWIF